MNDLIYLYCRFAGIDEEDEGDEEEEEKTS
jgi:hypothetical protein